MMTSTQHSWPCSKRSVALLAIGLSAVPAAGALAQTASSGSVLEEIVVTAQKRAESLQTVPVAITAVTAEDLAQNGVRQMEQLQNVAPAVQILQIVGSPTVVIRGIAAAAPGPSIEQPLALYLNNGYVPSPQAYNGHFFDVERSEILYGPQGTLYGRNAMSGVFNLITRRPGDKFGGYGELEVGNYDLTRFEGAVDLPFSDGAGARIAAMRQLRDGYFANDTGDAGETSARATLSFKPSANQQLLVIGDYEKTDNKNQAGGQPTSGATIYSSPNPSVVVPPHYNNNFAYGSNTLSFYHSKQYGLTAQYDYSFEPVTLTVLGSYRLLSSRGLGNDDFTLTRFGTVSSVSLAESVSNFNLKSLEVRLASNDTERLKWVAGAYGIYQSTNGGVTSYSGPTVNTAYNNYLANIFLLAMLNPRDITKSYAAFADATWTPAGLARLHLTAGGRYSSDSKNGTVVDGGGFIGGPVRATNGNIKSHAVTWRFAPSFDLTEASMVYLSAARGYEAGGFGFAPAGRSPEYKPQYVTSYELGSKNQFFDNRVRLNADVFYYDYKDKQYSYGYVTAGPTGTAINLGITNYDAKYWGSSLLLQVAPSRADLLSLDLAYTYAEIGASGRYLSQIDPSLQDSSPGDRERSVTPWSGNVSYRHTFNIRQALTLAPQALFHYTRYAPQKTVINGTTYALPAGTEVRWNTPDVKRLDLLLTLAESSDRWSVTAYVRNVTDRYDFAGPANYHPATSDGATGPGSIGDAEFYWITPLLPRTYGVFASTRF